MIRVFIVAFVLVCTVATLCLEPQKRSDANRIHSESRKPWHSSNIKGSPTPPAPYRIEPAFPKIAFQRPTSITQIPGTNRLLVTQINGKIFTFEKEKTASNPDLVIDLRAEVRKQFPQANVRVFHAAFHPGFESNRWVYVCYVRPDENGPHSRVSRFELTDDAIPTIDVASEQLLITWLAGGHNGGCLQFGPDGYLYISTGDGAGPNPPDSLTTGQTVTDLLGAILRIDVDAEDKPYAIPADNPFVDLDGARPEIWGYGLRNPFKFGIDRDTGVVYAADNGWESWELVHRVTRGSNGGWPIMEGRMPLRTEVERGPTPIVPPLKDHPHTEANSVIGGPVYQGEKLSELGGVFVYGDYITGTIWGLNTDSEELSHQTLLDTDLRIISFTEASEGELYVLDFDYTGQVYEILPSEEEDRSAEFPRALSETGLFAELSPLTPEEGVVPYEVVVDRWMDGANAQRWVAIPGSGRINLTEPDAKIAYPDGTVLVKHVSLDDGGREIPLETQLLHFENGSWNPYSYLWNEEGTEADLVETIGADRSVFVGPLTDPQERSWHVSAQNECQLCHNPGSGSVLGFVSEQLDVRADSGDAATSQLHSLFKSDVIAGETVEASFADFSIVDPFDESNSLDDRARSYLHANCSMCHHQGGNAIVSFFLRRDMEFGELNTDKGTGIGTFGMNDPKIITPGDPYRSVLFYRMSKLGYSRMPYIGSQSVDGAAIALIDEWIREMGQGEGDNSSAPIQAGSELAEILSDLEAGINSEQTLTEHVSQLLQSTEGALALTSKIHSGSLNDQVRLATINVSRTDVGSDVRGLVETFVPESERRKTLGSNPDPEAILSIRGDKARGELIYLSDSARCRNCHHVSDPDESLGPTLPEIREKYKQRGQVLMQILDPSKTIDDKYATYTAITLEGKIYSGLLISQDDQHVTLRLADKTTVALSADEIDELVRSDQSLMPQQLVSDLTAQELVDLLEYLIKRPTN